MWESHSDASPQGDDLQEVHPSTTEGGADAAEAEASGRPASTDAEAKDQGRPRRDGGQRHRAL